MSTTRPPPLHLKLLRWYDRHRRDLPWRKTKDPYQIWVSEVMLQQTQVATVIPYWHRFLSRYATVAALADADLPDVLAQWRGLGYYSRARNLHRAARTVVDSHQGKLPSNVAALLTLPGFGRYTAGAVASIAFDVPAPLVDGNVARVLCRLFAIEGPAAYKLRERRLWALAAELVPRLRPGDWNQALMELGATVCTSDNPTCLLCPLRKDCQAHLQGRTNELPPPRVRPPRKKLHLAACVWRKRGRVLLGRRKEEGLFGGLWELPTLEVPTDASSLDVDAAIRGNWGAELKVGEPLGRVKRTLTHRDLELLVLPVNGKANEKVQGQYCELKWALPRELRHLGISTAMQRAISLAVPTSRQESVLSAV